VALPPLRPAALRCADAPRELPPDFALLPPPLRRAELLCFEPPLLAPPLFFAPLLDDPLLLDELPLRELPDDLEPPREALLLFELLLLPPLLEPPRDAPAFEPPLLLPPDFAPERAAVLRFAEDADDLEPRDADDLELFEDALLRDDDALFLEPPLLLLEPPLAVPPLRPAAAFFADVDEELLEPPLLLLEPLLALPPLRPAAAFFADVDPELFELDPELFEPELLEPELFDDEPLFFELPLLFLDDDAADFLEAICVLLLVKKNRWGAVLFLDSETSCVAMLLHEQCRRTWIDCHVYAYHIGRLRSHSSSSSFAKRLPSTSSWSIAASRAS
jgi:hypothetical protein